MILTLIGAAMLAGQQHAHAIGQWVKEHAQVLVESLEPAGGRLPSEFALTSALVAVDLGELEPRLSRFVSGLGTQAAAAERIGWPKAGQSPNGRTMRGVGAYGRKLHLLSVATHGGGVAPAQAEVGRRPTR